RKKTITRHSSWVEKIAAASARSSPSYACRVPRGNAVSEKLRVLAALPKRRQPFAHGGRSCVQHLTNRIFGNLESYWQIGGVLSAGLCHIGTATAATAHRFRHWPDPFAGAQLAGLQVFADPRHQRHL